MLSLPNLLTLLRIAVIPIVVVAFYSDNHFGRWLAVITFFIGCLSDFFDGYFARLLSQTSPMGQMLDPIADKLLVISTLFLLAGFSRLKGLDLIPGVIIICREIFISGIREYLGSKQIRLPVTLLSKWKTSLQMLALGLLLFPEIPYLHTAPIWLGEKLLWVAAAITLWTGVDYLNQLLKRDWRKS